MKSNVLSDDDLSGQSTLTPSAALGIVPLASGAMAPLGRGIVPSAGRIGPIQTSEEIAVTEATVPLKEVAAKVSDTGQGDDILDNLDPVMQQYLNRVMKSKEAKQQDQPAKPADHSSHIDQVEFDKTDSDFSW